MNKSLLFRVLIFLPFFFSLRVTQAQEIVKLPNEASGQAAIKLLGPNLPIVANAHGLSEEKLRKIFEKDKSLNVDKGGRLYYIEQKHTEEYSTALGSPIPESYSSIPPENAFLLNSKPGSNRTIYLNFNGEVLSGTAWNATLKQDPYYAAPFDLDGSPNTFSTTERNKIIAIWKSVSEDFAPFDVNVTTQNPGIDAITRSGSADQVYGTVALITRDMPVCSSCGGVAYLNVFNSTSNYYKPALVFYNLLGNGSEKPVSEAISHEVGHNLALNHDGTTTGSSYYQGHGSGATGWAPIMGVAYSKPVSQWSMGEYSDANNKEDDISKIQISGLSLRVDDHGNDLETATFINHNGTFSAYGIIERRSDIDFFRFSAGVGDVQIDVLPSSYLPNLDILVRVFDSTGRLVGEANPTNGLAASLIFNSQAEGSYFISVDGVGLGDLASGYSDYASLGQYKISGVAPVISIINKPPVAVISASVTGGYAPLNVLFSSGGSNDPDGSIVSYNWNFGNGLTSLSPNPQVTFSLAGSYKVLLTVKDNGGLVATDYVTITVENDPAVLPAPSNLSGVFSNSIVTLNWQDNSHTEEGFRIYRRTVTITGKGRDQVTSYGPWTLIATVASNIYSHNDNNLVPANLLEYQVEAFNSSLSKKSNVVGVKIGSAGKPQKGLKNASAKSTIKFQR